MSQEVVQLGMERQWWQQGSGIGKTQVRTSALISAGWSGLNVAHESSHHLM